MRSERGVSEVIGTILILAMTVVLFASIILWVSAIPTPQASIRLDMDGQLAPIYDINGAWIGANFTARHRGGETLPGYRTNVFFTVERGGSFTTETLDTDGTVAGVPYGIDGPDADWDAGETWAYTNYSVLETDRVTLSVVDYLSAIITQVQGRRGQMGDIVQEDEVVTVHAKVPVADMFGFSNDIRGATQGRAIWYTEYAGYENVPSSMQSKLVPDIRQRKGEPKDPPTAESFLD